MDKKIEEAAKRTRRAILRDIAEGIFVLICGAISCWVICLIASALNL